MNNIKTVNIKTPMGIKLTLIPFIVLIFLKIGSANTTSITNITLVLFYFWFLSILFVKPKVVFKILNQSYYYSLFVFLLFLFIGLSYINGAFTSFKAIAAFVQVLAPIFMYEFYSKFLSKKTARNLILITLAIYIYYSFKTILYLEYNPMAARDIVSIGIDESLLIGGGFSLAYGFSILIPVLLYLIINHSKYHIYIFNNTFLTRSLLISAIIIFSITIYQSMFAISFLVMLFGCFFVLLNMNKEKRRNNILIYSSVLLMFFIYLSSNQITSFLNDYLSSIDSVLSRKLLIVLNLSEYSNVTEAGGLGFRLKLYLSSFYTWIDNPFFGIAYKCDFDSSKMIELGMGNHSEWFDLLAQYGLLSIFLMIYIFKTKHIYNNNTGFKIGLIIFIILGFLNPIFYFNIYFLVFFYIPLLDSIAVRRKILRHGLLI